MSGTSRALAAALIAVAATLPPHAAGMQPTQSRTQAALLTREADELAGVILKSRDHRGRPFAIVDKKDARIFVFDGAGRMRGTSVVLVGQAPGDASAPNVGEHAQQGIVPFEERTTPAGRFESQPGVNASGEPIVWVDYDSAFAIHRLRPGRAERARQERLATGGPAERRVSYGCVVVPVRFYEDVVQRWLGHGRAVVYVLPEHSSAREVFNAL